MAKRKRSSSLAFTHEPLADPGKEIRLIRFKGKRDFGKLRNIDCELSTWPLDEAPPYAAASYVWGSPEHTRWVTMNNRHYEVRRNCYEALSQIRRQVPDSYVWTDSICINQGDLDEKALQVAMMGDVYQRAAVVYSCVGDHCDGSKDVMRVVRELASYIRGIPLDAGSNRALLSRRKLCEIKPCPGTDIAGELSFNDDSDAQFLDPGFPIAFKAFGNRPYWNRVWIIQEVRLAQHCLILCGEDCTSIDDFQAFSEVTFDDHIKPTALYFRSTGYARRMRYKCRLIGMISGNDGMNSRPGERQEPLSISEALTSSQSRECADARDRLYALAKVIAWPPPANPPAPDYRISLFGLAIEVLRRLSGVRGQYFECAGAVGKLLNSFEVSVQDREVQQLLAERGRGVIQACNPVSFKELLPMKPWYYPPPAFRIRELEDGRLSLNHGLCHRPKDDAMDAQPTTYSSGLGRKLWVDDEVFGLVCPRTLPGDFLIAFAEKRPAPSALLVVRRDSNFGVFEIIGPAFTLPPHTAFGRTLPEEDELFEPNDTVLYSKLPLFFDLWFEDEDFLLWKIYTNSLQSDQLSDAQKDDFLQYRVAKSRFSSYATLRTDLLPEWVTTGVSRDSSDGEVGKVGTESGEILGYSV